MTQRRDGSCAFSTSTPHENRGTCSDLVLGAREHLLHPLTVGGGVRSAATCAPFCSQARTKVSFNSAAVAEP